METENAIFAFSALSQKTRLDVLRLLIRKGEDGMAAGDIAGALASKANTMSANLSILLRAGLVRCEREGRSIRYFADFDGIRAILAFLMEDCCGGHPERCQPILDELTCGC